MPLRAVNSINEEYLLLRQGVASHLVPLAQGDRSPIALAALMSSEDPGAVLDLLYQLVSDSIACTLAGSGGVKNRDLLETIERYASLVSVAGRYDLLDCINETQGLVAGTSNANNQMLLERVFFSAA